MTEIKCHVRFTKPLLVRYTQTSIQHCVEIEPAKAIQVKKAGLTRQMIVVDLGLCNGRHMRICCRAARLSSQIALSSEPLNLKIQNYHKK